MFILLSYIFNTPSLKVLCPKEMLKLKLTYS